MSENKGFLNGFSDGVNQVPLEERPKDNGKIINTDITSKKIQTDHIKMKADELTQHDFSNEDCSDDLVDSIASAIKIAPLLSPTRFLQTITPIQGILTELEQTHKEYTTAKYTLYEKRANFYTKENRQKCKEETGKDTDKSFDEYFKQKHLNLIREREEKEFRYEQAKRVFESLK